MTRFTLLAAAFAVALSTTAFAAQTVHERIGHMQTRIERGIKTGDLTRREAGELRKELNAIQRREDRMRRDGRLDQRERDVLHADLDRLDRHITREKRDDQRRR